MTKLLLFSIHGIETCKKVYLISFLVLLNIIIHLPFAGYPPVGYHLWRQTQGLSIARNYSDESMNFFQPRVDSRGKETGITGVEFPLTYYTMALGYKVFGYHNSISRIVTLAFSFTAIIFSFLFFEVLFRRRIAGLIGGLVTMFSPLSVYYSFVALPDIPALGCIFGALYFWLKYDDDSKVSYLIISGFFMTISGLLKISTLLVLLFFIFTALKRNKKFASFVTVAASLVITCSWYAYARYLSNTYNNYDFLLGWKLPYDLHTALYCTKKMLIVWLPEMYLNYGAFILFMVGIYSLCKTAKKTKTLSLFLSTVGIGLLCFIIVMLPMLDVHDYYMIPSLPFLLTISVTGAMFLIEKYERENSSKVSKILLYILIICVPILGGFRGLSRFVNGLKTAPNDLLTIEPALNTIIPDNQALVIATDDVSPSILLYYFHRKGWSAQENISSGRIFEMHEQGAKYLISNSRALESRPEIHAKIDSIGSYERFRVFRFR
jgi:4-amino-4-deoxy-L-arabinose transferase-like glycosyltransferase